MSLLAVDRLNSYYGDSHILFDVSMPVEAHEVEFVNERGVFEGVTNFGPVARGGRGRGDGGDHLLGSDTVSLGPL